MFRNDYSEIAAPEVLVALAEKGLEQNVGYGLDKYSENAEKLILKRFGLKNGSKVFFLGGGTQTNMTVLSFLLKPYEAVISCDTGHINVHETGAVEGSGHKILTAKNEDGKLTPEGIVAILKKHTDEHSVKIKGVYISDTTETGTVYKKSELLAIRKTCDENGLFLFLDGARLGVALTVSGGDVTPELIGEVADVFYVGGTKNGATHGEAVVIKDENLARDFRYHIKNRGAMLAKGYVLGIEFERLFSDGLYFDLAKRSNKASDLIRSGLKKLNVKEIGGSTTNQIFVEFDNGISKRLEEEFGLELWEDKGDKKVMRIVTSFATTEKDAENFVEAVKKLVK